MENSKEILQFLNAIWMAGEIRELRLIKKGYKKDILSGYFDNPILAAEAILRIRDERFMYITLNPVNEQLSARNGINRLERAQEGDATADKDIVSVRFILIDCDPKRPKNTSSTKEQVEASLEIAEKIKTELGRPFLFAMSGNGTHLIYRLVEKTTAEERSGLLQYLAKKFDTEVVEIDKKCFNSSRITKIIGTKAIKGKSSPKYPHRISKIIEINQDSIPISPQNYTAITTTCHQSTINFDVRRFLTDNGVLVKKEEPWRDATKLILEQCVFDPSHTGKDACIILRPDGSFQKYACFHNSCDGKTWADVRAAIGAPRAKKICECGEEVKWTQYQGKWVLITNDGVPHKCRQKTGKKQSESIGTIHRLPTIPQKMVAIDEIIAQGENKQAPQMPDDVFPKVIRDFIHAKANSIGTNPEFIFLGSLVAFSVALQGSTIYVNPDWTKENTSLYGSAVGETGQGKSPALEAAIGPLFEISHELQEKYEHEKEQYKEKMAEYEEEMADRKKSRQLSPLPERPEKPQEKVLIVSNSTVEALAMAFQSSPAILLYKDELTGWINGFGQYKNGRGDDKEFFLSGWTGTFIKLIRAGRTEGISLPERPCLSVLGGIVPENLGKLRQDFEEDGFVERILFVYPDKIKRRYSVCSTPKEVQKEYSDILQRTYRKGAQSFFIDQIAECIFENYYNICQERIEKNHPIKGALAKFPSQALRIAAIFSAISGTVTISGEIMEKAIRTCFWLETQTEKVMGVSALSQEISAAKKILEWAAKKGKTTVTARDVVIYTRTCKTTAVAKEILAEMVEMGVAAWSKEGKEIFVDAVDAVDKKRLHS